MTETTQVSFVPVADITVKSRVRKVFSPHKLEMLKVSIAENGLIHPLTAYIAEEPGKYVLVTGERRLRVMTELCKTAVAFKFTDEDVPPGTVPVRCFPNELEAEKALVIEGEENIMRAELTGPETNEWYRLTKNLLERAHASGDMSVIEGLIDKNPRLDEAQKAAAKQGLPPPGSTWKVKDTAAVVGMTPKHAQKHDSIAAFLEDDNLPPDVREAVAEAKSFRDAVAIRKKFVEAQLRKAMDQPNVKHTWELVKGDCLEVLQDIKYLSKMDMIITDPPYGVGAQDFAKKDFATSEFHGRKHEYTDDPESFQKLMTSFAPLAFSILKPDRQMWVFCDIRNFNFLAKTFRAAGFYVAPRPFIWVKNIGPSVHSKLKLNYCYEAVLVAMRGLRDFTNKQTGVLSFAKEAHSQHPAEKPLKLLTHILSLGSFGGEVICDPFCGSGSTGVAAITSGREAICVEMSDKYEQMARTRLTYPEKVE